MTEFSEKEFDVIGFAKSIMREVESVRSFQKVTDTETKEGFQLPTEPRIDAFLRLIGLPYFVSITGEDNKGKDDHKFLNSGFSKTVRSTLADKKIENNSKQEYKNPDQVSGKIGRIVSSRKDKLKEMTEKIGGKEMNTRMSKALCAPLDILPNFPKKTLEGEGDFTPKRPPNNGPDHQNKRKVIKRLFPLVPSYCQVLPLSNEIARPFTLSTSERRIDRDTVLRKPFLEQVVRIRFVIYGNSQTTSELVGQSDFVSSIKELIGEKEFSSIFSNDEKIFSNTNLVEQFVINKFLDAIKNLARRWVKINEQRINLLRKIRPTVNIKTSSSRQSLFGKRIEASVDLDNTSEGEKIKKLNALIAREEALISLLPTDENEEFEPNTGKTRNITPSALQNSFTELINYNLKKNKEVRSSLISRSKKNITALEKIRLELDVMTGEFTGLSLPDVVCTIAALFIIDKTKLLNLLDKYVVDSMKTDNVLKAVVKNTTPTASNAMEAVQELEKRVNQLFALFQKEVEAVQSRKIQGRRAVSIRKSDEKEPSTPVCYVSEET